MKKRLYISKNYYNSACFSKNTYFEALFSENSYTFPIQRHFPPLTQKRDTLLSLPGGIMPVMKRFASQAPVDCV